MVTVVISRDSGGNNDCGACGASVQVVLVAPVIGDVVVTSYRQCSKSFSNGSFSIFPFRMPANFQSPSQINSLRVRERS